MAWVQGESDIDRGSATADAYDDQPRPIHQRCPPDFQSRAAILFQAVSPPSRKSIPRRLSTHYANYLVLRSQQSKWLPRLQMLT